MYKKDKNPNAEYKGRNFDFDIKIEEIVTAETGIDEELRKYVDYCM